MRPGVELVTTTSLTAGRVSPRIVASRVGSSTMWYSPAKARSSPSSSSSASIAVRKPTRPKLTPKTGTPVPRKRSNARSIVPSPPSVTTRSGFCSTTSAPAAAATLSTLETATAPAPECVATTTRRTRSADGVVDPVAELGGELRPVSLDEVEEELTIPFRTWQA